MGATGTGKSHVSRNALIEPVLHECSFSKIIDTLIGQNGRLSGNSLECVTEYVTGHRIQNHPEYGSSLVCVDTPGFDDTHLSDMDILAMISEWLKYMYVDFL
jgi:predicted GTPase